MADTILSLYRNGAIRQRFSASEIEHLLAGVFSDSEIRRGLAGMMGHHYSTPADKRFRQLKKYHYEIVDAGVSPGS